MNTKLLYVGDGTAYPDVPARDLSEEEAAYYGLNRLLQSGLYKLPDKPKPAAKPKKEAARAEGE